MNLEAETELEERTISPRHNNSNTDKRQNLQDAIRLLTVEENRVSIISKKLKSNLMLDQATRCIEYKDEIRTAGDTLV